MSIDLVSNPGGFFPRMGRILHVAYLIDQFEATLPAAFSAISAQFASSLQPVGGLVELQAETMARQPSAAMSFAADAALALVVQTVLADQPSQAVQFVPAMSEIIRQMKVQAKTVQSCAVTVTPTAMSGFVGNGVLITSTKRGDGLVQENAVAETLRLTCVGDSYDGGAAAGQEQFGLAGAPAVAGLWDYDYPRGSGAAFTLSAISASQDAATDGNLLTNGDAEDWSADVIPQLSFWTLSTGTWGTDAARNSTANRGSFALQFLPTATNTVLYQEFGDQTAGTAVFPSPLQSYAVNLWIRKLSGTISAGVLTVELTDDANAVTADAQAVNNSFTIDLTTITTSYVAKNAVFRVGATPSTLRLRLRVSTAISGGSVLVDDVCFAPLTAMYSGGPGFAVFSGATLFAANDGWSIANTNDRGGASYLATFQSGMDRLLNMSGNGLLLPSSGSPNIADTLITS